MANNNFDSNFTRKLARSFTTAFENERVISKNVNTQFIQTNSFNPSTGDTIDIKRPTDFVSVRTPDGDVSGETESPIITGKASAVVQEYFTAFVDYKEADEAIKMDQLDQLLAPLATRIVTDMELDFARFAMANTALLSGTVGNSVQSWKDVANAGAMLDATGVPMGSPICYAMNPFTQRELADDQRSLGGETGSMTANQRATITENFAGMKVMTCNTLGRYTTGAGAGRTGTLSGTPLATYTAAKDTMTQQVQVTGLDAGLTINAGETVSIGDVNRLNLATREAMIDGSGNPIKYTATVVQSVTLDGSGSGTLVITGPAIFETEGAYNTVGAPLQSGDAIEVLGSAETIIQPNLAWHKDAFCIGSVGIEKLHSTDTLATTPDGLQMRVSKGVGFLQNQQKVRFDFRPAYGVLNPFFATKSFGL